MGIEFGMFDIATIAAVVAALVTVVGNAFDIEKKYRSLLAIGFACIIVFLPNAWSNQLLVALVVGLTASGVYSQVKPKVYKDKLSDNLTKQSNNNKENN